MVIEREPEAVCRALSVPAAETGDRDQTAESPQQDPN